MIKFTASVRRLGLILALAIGILPVAGATAAPPLTPANFNLSTYKGKVVYLDFWASWCGPCKLSFPFMENLEYTFPGKDLVIIAVNLDHSRARADAFLKDVGNANFPIIYDKKGKLATRFHVSAMPTSVLIGRDGKIRYVHKGFFKEKEDQYVSDLSKLINEKQ